MHLLLYFTRKNFINNVLHCVLFLILSTLQIEIPLTLSSISNHANYIRYSGMLNSVDYKLLTGQFFIGTPKQSLNLLLDTTSSVSWIPKSNLNNYFMHTFDPSRSKTFFNFGTSKDAPYEDLIQKGELSADVMDFTTQKRNKQLAPNFHFILVDSEEEPNSKVTGFDGTMSLLRHDHIKNIGRKSLSSCNTDELTGYSLPEYLAEEHIITRNKFAIEFLPNNHSTLYIDEEELLNEIISNKNNTSGKCSFNKDFNPNWHCLIKSVNIKQTSEPKQNKNIKLLSNEYAILDSSQPYIIAPRSSGLSILEHYRSLYVGCSIFSKYDTYTFLVCRGNYFNITNIPKLCITLGNKEICLENEDLFYTSHEEITKDTLYVFKLIVFEFDNDEWKLGLPVFYRRMVMFDNDLNQITFVDVNEYTANAHDYNKRKVLRQKEDKTIYIKRTYVYIIILIIIMLCVMLGVYSKHNRLRCRIGNKKNHFLINNVTTNLVNRKPNAVELKEIINSDCEQ